VPQSAELQVGPVGPPPGRRSAAPEAVRQREVQDGEPGQRNGEAAVRRGEPGQRNAVPVAVQDGEPGQRNGEAAVRRGEPAQRNAVLAAVQREEQEGPDAVRRRPSVFQAVLIR
jgi:hypothetical protein